MTGSRSVLVCRAGGALCAFPLEHVVETMRPQPCRAVPGMRDHVLGLALIRGQPTPVVALGEIIDPGGRQMAPTRLVSLFCGGVRGAVAVDAVTGIEDIEVEALASLPEVVSSGSQPIVDRVASFGDDLLLLLASARLIPQELPEWAGE